MTLPQTGPSADTRAIMRFAANSRSVGVAYLLWFFLGSIGAHRFYAGRTGSGVLMLLLSLAGWANAFLLVGYIPLGIVAVWWFVDLFLIPGLVRDYNERLLAHLGA